MKILGVDPGSLVTGYGLVESGRERPEVLASGVIETNPSESLPRRLLVIYTALKDLIERTSPDEIAVENLFHGANVRSLTVIAEVRGVILLAGAACGVPIAEYSPREVKMSVAGRGGATKDQVRSMVLATTTVSGALESTDAADGIAVALCHLGRKGQAA